MLFVFFLCSQAIVSACLLNTSILYVYGCVWDTSTVDEYIVCSYLSVVYMYTVRLFLHNIYTRIKTLCQWNTDMYASTFSLWEKRRHSSAGLVTQRIWVYEKSRYLLCLWEKKKTHPSCYISMAPRSGVTVSATLHVHVRTIREAHLSTWTI